MEANIRVLRFADVKRKVGLGRDSIYKLAREGKFPAPLKLSERASGWIESEINQFITDRAAQRKQVPPRTGDLSKKAA